MYRKSLIMISPILLHLPAPLLHRATSVIGHYIHVQGREVSMVFLVRKILKNKNSVWSQIWHKPKDPKWDSQKGNEEGEGIWSEIDGGLARR